LLGAPPPPTRTGINRGNDPADSTAAAPVTNFPNARRENRFDRPLWPEPRILPVIRALPCGTCRRHASCQVMLTLAFAAVQSQPGAELGISAQSRSRYVARFRCRSELFDSPAVDERGRLLMHPHTFPFSAGRPSWLGAGLCVAVIECLETDKLQQSLGSPESASSV
jgi:hypothetical protein